MNKTKKVTIELIFEYDKKELKNIRIASPFNNKNLHDNIIRLIVQFIKDQIGMSETSYIQ